MLDGRDLFRDYLHFYRLVKLEYRSILRPCFRTLRIKYPGTIAHANLYIQKRADDVDHRVVLLFDTIT